MGVGAAGMGMGSTGVVRIGVAMGVVAGMGSTDGIGDGVVAASAATGDGAGGTGADVVVVGAGGVVATGVPATLFVAL